MLLRCMPTFMTSASAEGDGWLMEKQRAAANIWGLELLAALIHVHRPCFKRCIVVLQLNVCTQAGQETTPSAK